VLCTLFLAWPRLFRIRVGTGPSPLQSYIFLTEGWVQGMVEWLSLLTRAKDSVPSPDPEQRAGSQKALSRSAVGEPGSNHIVGFPLFVKAIQFIFYRQNLSHTTIRVKFRYRSSTLRNGTYIRLLLFRSPSFL
jgi:hypothetical protein